MDMLLTNSGASLRKMSSENIDDLKLVRHQMFIFFPALLPVGSVRAKLELTTTRIRGVSVGVHFS